VSQLEDFAKSDDARRIAGKIRSTATRRWTIMELCGAHTRTILQCGIDEMLADNIQIVHGPGCVISITPLNIIDRAFAVAYEPDVTMCVFGDMLRVTGTRNDLLEAKASGADVRVVYDAATCVELAKEHPERKIVYFSVGSERLLPGCAASLLEAKQLGLKNYFVLSSQANMSTICSGVLQRHSGQIDAVLASGTSCSVVGFKDYETVSKQFNIPIIVSGVEPLEVLESLYKSIVQLENGRSVVENQCPGFVSRSGNSEQQSLINQAFRLMDFEWRRLGTIANSGFQLREELDGFNAWTAFHSEPKPAHESAMCISEEIMLGLKKPADCPAFGKHCTPHRPVGATMVSSDGTCALYHKFRTAQQDQEQEQKKDSSAVFS